MFYDLEIGDIDSATMRSIRDAITSIDMSWTLDAASEVSFEVWDPEFRLVNGNYFQIRRDVRFNGDLFEISVVDIGQGPTQSPVVRIEARRKAIQRMKRDKNPEAYGGGTATDYARAVAAAYGLAFEGQGTDAKAVQIQASSDGRSDSVWDVLKRNANEAQFVVFESDNTLYFASEEWLLGKWANVAFNWPTLNPLDPFPLYQIPNCRTSDDDPRAADVRFVVGRTNAVNLRPGMTVVFNGINGFGGSYLITTVSYEMSPMEPVSVSARTPVKPEPRAQARQ
jgi:hypothetical protein